MKSNYPNYFLILKLKETYVEDYSGFQPPGESTGIDTQFGHSELPDWSDDDDYENDDEDDDIDNNDDKNNDDDFKNDNENDNANDIDNNEDEGAVGGEDDIDPNDAAIGTSAVEIVQQLLDLAGTNEPIVTKSYALRYWLAVTLFRWRTNRSNRNIEKKLKIPRATVR